MAASGHKPLVQLACAKAVPPVGRRPRRLLMIGGSAPRGGRIRLRGLKRGTDTPPPRLSHSSSGQSLENITASESDALATETPGARTNARAYIGARQRVSE